MQRFGFVDGDTEAINNMTIILLYFYSQQPYSQYNTQITWLGLLKAMKVQFFIRYFFYVVVVLLLQNVLFTRDI